MRRLAVIALAVVALTRTSSAQQPIGAMALGDLVQGLGVNTRVLVIGAHPDDEDTYLISWLARGRHVETAYLSLTRGEGGQNLIGNELGFALGMIRTEELLAARRIDGGHQYFTRAIDFGFSKTFAETDSIWPHHRILNDVITVIRAFRPQVIVSVWSGTPADGHGHHQYAGVLAREAFDAAADTVHFPIKETGGLFPWTPAKFYRRPPGGTASSGALMFNVGEYNPLLGRSYAEIAALSRSQHLSQGMGMMLPLGVQMDGVQLDTSRLGVPITGEKSIFDGIDTTWARFAPILMDATIRAAIDSLPAAVHDAQNAFAAPGTATLIPTLGRVVRLATAARAGVQCPEVYVPRCGAARADLAASLNTTLDRASRALLLAAGVVVDATSPLEELAARDSADVTIAVYNRGHANVEVLGGSAAVQGKVTELGTIGVAILPDSALRLGGKVATEKSTFPWWLLNGRDLARPMIYDIDDDINAYWPMLIGDDRAPASRVDLKLRIDGTEVIATAAPIVNRFADPAHGERNHPLAVVPKVTSLFPETVEFARADLPLDRPLHVTIHSAWEKVDTLNVSITLPKGLVADSAARRVIIPPHGTMSVFFRVRGTVREGRYPIPVHVIDRTGFYQLGIVDINYDHIPPVRFFEPPEMTLSVVKVEVPDKLDVAYVRGVGDNIEPMLEQLKIKAHTIAPEALSALDLTTYTTLVIGPRAYEAIEAVASNASAIQDFARRGGTVVVQYSQDPTKPGVLPFPVTLNMPVADRVTDEHATVNLLDTAAKVMNWPNKITARDFGGWVQERGLYMPTTFDSNYTALFSMHDPGEPANSAGVLVAQLGKGMFVYTTLSFFRQLPAGVPGAARLLVNLLAAGMKPGVVP